LKSNNFSCYTFSMRENVPERSGTMPRRAFLKGFFKSAVAGAFLAAGGRTASDILRGGSSNKTSPAARSTLNPPLTEEPQSSLPSQKQEGYDVFHDLTPGAKEQAENTVKQMEEVIKKNGSYKEMVAVVLKHENTIRKFAQEYNVPAEVALGIALIENGGGEDQISPGAGARGIMQLMPETAKEHIKVDIKKGVDERTDPVKNIYAGVRYLADLYKLFPDWGIVTWGYHAGQGNIWWAIETYFKDTRGVDLGAITFAKEDMEALKMKQDYHNAVLKNRLNAHQILSNEAVKEQVITHLVDESELYFYKAVAGARLFQEEKAKASIAVVPQSAR